MPPPVIPAADTSPTWAIRLEAKVDVALAHQGARLDTHSADIADHEMRIREVEQRRTVSPWQLWLAVTGGVGTLAALVGVLSTLLPA